MNKGDRWTPLTTEAFRPILSSGKTYELLSQDWPAWARRPGQVARMFAYALAPGERLPSAQTTGHQVGRLLSERYDSGDSEPWNYNWYAVVQSSNGSLYQSGPSRDIDFGHHLQEPVSNLSIGVGRNRPPSN